MGWKTQDGRCLQGQPRRLLLCVVSQYCKRMEEKRLHHTSILRRYSTESFDGSRRCTSREGAGVGGREKEWKAAAIQRDFDLECSLVGWWNVSWGFGSRSKVSYEDSSCWLEYASGTVLREFYPGPAAPKLVMSNFIHWLLVTIIL